MATDESQSKRRWIHRELIHEKDDTPASYKILCIVPSNNSERTDEWNSISPFRVNLILNKTTARGPMSLEQRSVFYGRKRGYKKPCHNNNRNSALQVAQSANCPHNCPVVQLQPSLHATWTIGRCRWAVRTCCIAKQQGPVRLGRVLLNFWWPLKICYPLLVVCRLPLNCQGSRKKVRTIYVNFTVGGGWLNRGLFFGFVFSF